MQKSKPFSDQLRQAVLQCGKTRYRIGVETGIAHSIISRFINHGAGLSMANVDMLCECLGVELVFANGQTKPQAKKHAVKRSEAKRKRK